jgi:hypothetical protein
LRSPEEIISDIEMPGDNTSLMIAITSFAGTARSEMYSPRRDFAAEV